MPEAIRHPVSIVISATVSRIPQPSPRSLPEEDRMEAYLNRVVIETVQPQIDSGRFPARRAIGETVVVTADIFADSHDRISAELMFRKTPDARWQRRPLELLGNDRWQGAFRVSELGVPTNTPCGRGSIISPPGWSCCAKKRLQDRTWPWTCSKAPSRWPQPQRGHPLRSRPTDAHRSVPARPGTDDRSGQDGR
jgi:hypothetical protein